MAVSKDFLNYVLDLLSDWGEIYVKRMFGGVALFRDDFTFAMIARDVVYLKVDETNIDKFIAQGSTPLKPFKSDALVKSFYMVPPDIFEDSEAFIEWAKESLEIQIKKNR
ncbi:TfoX/Sxy family protein [Ancylomarina sp. 16SWW S1-10-2]|uniref:TfoX/Sxy family protein n=1 Tax=Ancylomarina sp. 16SWW S1-10-2 TaxID=2499681 RepID=UPI0012AD42DA|nr:TfoX/Sxy family protein [Ancylomarina sp. 16SWW S1-10-2]MRT92689.1 TfoX family protein [Ancylomarina sp. 16SWW S1-10-2]